MATISLATSVQQPSTDDTILEIAEQTTSTGRITINQLSFQIQNLQQQKDALTAQINQLQSRRANLRSALRQLQDAQAAGTTNPTVNVDINATGTN